MPYVPIGYEQSVINGMPYFALYNEVFDDVETLQKALNNPSGRNMTDNGWIPFFYSDRSQIDEKIISLNSPFFVGVNVQSQKRILGDMEQMPTIIHTPKPVISTPEQMPTIIHTPKPVISTPVFSSPTETENREGFPPILLLGLAWAVTK